MNHLPVPAERRRPGRVPYFGNYDVPFLGHRDGAESDFYDSPVAKRFVDENGKSIIDLDDLHEPEDVDLWFAEVQAWLYFGLIRHVFGPSATTKDFLNADPSRPDTIIDSTKLKEYMAQWRRTVGRFSKANQQTELQRIKQSTTTGWKFCDWLDRVGIALKEPHMLVLFSIRILISSIWDMMWVSDLASPENLNEDYRLSMDVVKWPHLPASYRPLAVLMAEYDWCPREILRLLGTYHLTTIWSMTCLLRTTLAGLDHMRCVDSAKCVARDVIPAEHQAEHIHNDCNCEAVGPDMEQVKAILRAGQIPIIRCNVSHTGHPSFKVLESKGVQRHIAFSHVWADKIVISRENKIYKCQFLNLFSYLEMARTQVQAERLFYLPFAPFLARHVLKGSKSVDIWLDIFCIPSVLHEDAEELRTKAIARIYPVFAGAESVLIIDKALMRTESTGMSTTEVMARVAASGWMTRCWTFSEMSLARKSILLFCVGKSVVHYEDFQEHNKAFRMMDAPGRSCFRDLLRSTFHPFEIAWFASQAVVSEYVAFGLVWNSLTARSTSWPEDVWGIMATLLGYSAREIMALQEADRLPAMMKTLPKVPASFLFRDLPRSSSGPAARRWVPTRVQGLIRDPDGTLELANEGIIFPRTLTMKFLIVAAGALPRTFSFELDSGLQSRLDQLGLKTLRYEISLHDADAARENVRAGDQICLLLPRNEATAGESEVAYYSGIGCALLATRFHGNRLLETDYLSSLSYRISSGESPSDFQGSMAPPIVRLSCDREQWYTAKARRQKHRLPPWTLTNLLYYWVPGALVTVMILIMVPLWVWYAVTDQPIKVQARLVYSTCACAVFFVVVMFVVIFHERFLFRNWVESFEDGSDGKSWWRRIMPLY
jgi:hypothetical protein